MPEPCIVAMGGGGWGSEPNSRLLDNYILSLARKTEGRAVPRICFVPTASGDSDQYIVRFYNAFRDGRATPTHLGLFSRSIDDLRSFVLAQDVIYVGGGNTANMMAVWHTHGLVEILREAWATGIVMCGLSAGSICWYEEGVTDSFGQKLQPISGCLGFLPGSHCPHYDGEVERRPAYQRLIAERTLSPGMAADDGVALKYLGTELSEIVSSRPVGRAWRVVLTDDGVSEEELLPRFLGE